MEAKQSPVPGRKLFYATAFFSVSVGCGDESSRAACSRSPFPRPSRHRLTVIMGTTMTAMASRQRFK